MSQEPVLPVRTQVVNLLYDRGPMDSEALSKQIKNVARKTVENACLALLKLKLLDRTDEGVYSIPEGKTPESIEVEFQQQATTSKQDRSGDSADGTQGTGKSLDVAPLFTELLKSVGVNKDVIPTITNLFMRGDTNSMKWLKEVVTDSAKGWFNSQQAKLVLSSWAKTQGLPFEASEYGDNETTGPDKSGSQKPPAKTVAEKLQDDTGIGFKVAKDRDGDWVPQPGGPLTYKEALEASEKQNYIKAMTTGPSADTSSDTTEPGTKPGKPGTGRGARDLQTILLEKMVDQMLDPKKGRGEDDPVLIELRRQNDEMRSEIRGMKDAQEKERLDRIEANLAAIASRDPFGDPAELRSRLQQLGISGSTVTDASPAVQLIKDTGDKFDKLTGRIVGIIERASLRGDEFRPENTRTPEEREDKASQLLKTADNVSRQKDLRKKTFGV